MKARVIAASAAAVLATGACGGDDLAGPDASRSDALIDAPTPAPPELGQQLDRMGRPFVELALVGTFLDTPAVEAEKKQRYGQAAVAKDWATAEVATGRTIASELAANLAIVDILDKGRATAPNVGCGNQLLYNERPEAGGSPTPTSYQALARILADDMLYVDTTAGTCPEYFTLELEATTGGAYLRRGCGGRTPDADTADTTYSFSIAGREGFVNPTGAPRFTDGVPKHGDLGTVFPYFGTPH